MAWSNMVAVGRLSWGLWFMIQGAAGYEQAMASSDEFAASFDAVLQIVGFTMFWTGAARIYGERKAP